MAVKRLNPITPGQRFRVANAFEELTASTPERSLLAPIKKSGGRNNQGKMTVRNIGGGHKRRYRVIDFKRNKEGQAEVKTIEYDPNRSAFISLIEYQDGTKSYILTPVGLKIGQIVESGESVAPEIGNCLPLSKMPLGSIVHNIELQPGKGGEICRSAGTNAQLLARDGKYAIVKMPSGESRMILGTCVATIGTVSNPDHSLIRLGKAGRNRWLGRRPRVRPAAMNPVDHPQGGGEGKSKGGQARSRKGIPSKGLKTRNVNKSSNKFIIERRKK
ncbi:MAG: 50S ribosomal protein L2 [Flavobacteriales bacterium]|nr:50S ribosomal protein L2 [Flavobacteriales bacterium]